MLIPTLLLLSLGITVIYTSSQVLAIQQLIFALVGVVFYLALQGFDYRLIRGLVRPIYILVLILLVVTLVVGIETRGSIRWIPIGPFNLQPSEFAKLSLILILAQFWTRHIPTWRNILFSLLISLPMMGLVFRQPDLGTTLTIGFVWLVMLLAANISLVKLVILSLISLILAPLSWLLLQDYQKLRLLGFLAPNQDPQGVGFHVIQSTIAVGSGQFFGRGLGRGTQSRLQFLPEFRTDFIFAFIAEELGFLGSVIVLALYAITFWLIFRILRTIDDRFGELIIIGVLAMLFFQLSVNIGMNTGLLPITGITLPLLSYGGSSIITTLLSLGFVVSVAKFGKRKDQVDSFKL